MATTSFPLVKYLNNFLFTWLVTIALFNINPTTPLSLFNRKEFPEALPRGAYNEAR